MAYNCHKHLSWVNQYILLSTLKPIKVLLELNKITICCSDNVKVIVVSRIQNYANLLVSWFLQQNRCCFLQSLACIVRLAVFILEKQYAASVNSHSKSFKFSFFKTWFRLKPINHDVLHAAALTGGPPLSDKIHSEKHAIAAAPTTKIEPFKKLRCKFVYSENKIKNILIIILNKHGGFFCSFPKQ